MSLRALTHFLFDRAGFNRWMPAMEGRRNQGVLHKYLMGAAEDIRIKGVRLSDRLYVPEPFREGTVQQTAQRRREKLALLHARPGDTPMAVLIGEFKLSEPALRGRKVWIKHMPDVPLWIDAKSWARVERRFAPILEARDADLGARVRIVMTALIRNRREYTYEIDSASLMLASEHWIPVEGLHELPLVHELVAQQRRFLKPLRYDARNAVVFPTLVLLDIGQVPEPLQVVSPFMPASEQEERMDQARAESRYAWVWKTDEAMPALPPRDTRPMPQTRS